VPNFDCPVYRALFKDICSLFPGPNFTFVIIPAQEAWSLLTLCRRSPDCFI